MLRGFLDRRRLQGWQRVQRVQNHGERDAVAFAHLLDRLEFRDRAIGTSPEVKVGEDCSRTRVESKCFADGQALVKRWTVCTDGDHPLLPSCAVFFSSCDSSRGLIQEQYSGRYPAEPPLHGDRIGPGRVCTTRAQLGRDDRAHLEPDL